MTIPPGFLDELRARIPLSDIVGRRVRLLRAGREWKAPCPFHAEKTPSFYVNDQKSFFHCFGCGAHGDAVGFLMRHDGLAFPDAVEQLAGLAGLAMPKPEPAEQQKYDRLKLLANALEAAATWFEHQLRSQAGRDALAYLEHRGLDAQTIAEFRLGYAPPVGDALRAALVGQGHDEPILEEVGLIRRQEDGRSPYAFFRNRVIFPVADPKGRIVAFGGRILEGDGPKYVNSPEHALFHKGSVLYGMARARAAIAKGARPVVVEGYMDVISMQRAGIAGAVAPLGTALGEAQLALLWKAQDDRAALDHPPVLCFDGDAAGRRAAQRSIERVLPLLAPSRSVAVAFLPQGDDPDSLIRRGGAGEIGRVLDGALPLIEAVWEFAASGRSLTTPEQRAGLWAELDGQLRAIADRQVQALYRVELKRRFDALFFKPRSAGGRGRSAQAVGPGSGGAGFGRPGFAGPRLAGPRVDPARHAPLILAAVINHPYLLDDWSDVFAEIDLPVAWRPLRHAVFDAWVHEQHEVLDADRLCGHLRSTGYGEVLDEVLARAASGGARRFRPGATQDEVREHWMVLLAEWRAVLLEKELSAIKSERGRDDRTERMLAIVSERLSGWAARQVDRKAPADQSGPSAHVNFAAEVLRRNPLGAKPVRPDMAGPVR